MICTKSKVQTWKFAEASLWPWSPGWEPLLYLFLMFKIFVFKSLSFQNFTNVIFYHSDAKSSFKPFNKCWYCSCRGCQCAMLPMEKNTDLMTFRVLQVKTSNSTLESSSRKRQSQRAGENDTHTHSLCSLTLSKCDTPNIHKGQRSLFLHFSLTTLKVSYVQVPAFTDHTHTYQHTHASTFAMGPWPWLVCLFIHALEGPVSRPVLLGRRWTRGFAMFLGLISGECHVTALGLSCSGMRGLNVERYFRALIPTCNIS